MGGLDKTDKRIVAALVENSKVMSKELSRKLRIHPNTLLQRLKKLEKEGVIKGYTAVVDYKKVEHLMQVMVSLKIEMIKGWEEHLRPLSRLPEVEAFLLITGEYDVIAIVRVRDELHLANLLRRMQQNKVVTKTTTTLILDYYKRPYEYNPLKDELLHGKPRV